MPIDTSAKDLERALEFRIINWIAIIDQLATTAGASSLKAINLPMAEFTMLNHFMHRPCEGKTISVISRQRQMPQPGVSKIIRKMVNKGLLREEAHDHDARSFVLFVTSQGAEAYQQAIVLLQPSLEGAFADWDADEKRSFMSCLERLKEFFEQTRSP